jgi:CRP-like cAMP-binding protein
MNYQEYFLPFQPLGQEAIDLLLSRCVERKYKKGEIITPEGSIQRELLVVEEGVQMSYFNNDGKMHVIGFTYAPSISGIPDSFLFQRPSKYTLQALTGSRFQAISFERLQQLFDEAPVIERLFRKIGEAILAGLIDRHLELQAYTIEQRFRLFAQRSPHLFQLVPHKYIANYLRIDPTNFSKLYNSVRI